MIKNNTAITTADGATLHSGDRAFNYYDQKPGYIGNDIDDDGWFTFYHDDTTRSILNGERICTEGYPRRRYPG